MIRLSVFDCFRTIGWLRAVTGVVGITLAVFFLAWLLVGWLGWVPAMVDLFGVDGMRTPASFTVAGLLLAAISFWEC